jgi:hypothetical protein
MPRQQTVAGKWTSPRWGAPDSSGKTTFRLAGRVHVAQVKALEQTHKANADGSAQTMLIALR